MLKAQRKKGFGFVQGAKRPTPTQSTCLYYYHDNEASKCVFFETYLLLAEFSCPEPSPSLARV